jgi:hypothetical protein
MEKAVNRKTALKKLAEMKLERGRFDLGESKIHIGEASTPHFSSNN